MSNSLKFYNPITGEQQSMKLFSKKHHFTNIDKLVTFMNSKGFIRGGKRQSMNDTEKKLLADAPLVRERIAENRKKQMDVLISGGKIA